MQFLVASKTCQVSVLDWLLGGGRPRSRPDSTPLSMVKSGHLGWPRGEGDLLDRAQAARAVRGDVTTEEVMALVAGAFAAIRHAGAENNRERSAHLAQLILDGLRPRPG